MGLLAKILANKVLLTIAITGLVGIVGGGSALTWKYYIEPRKEKSQPPATQPTSQPTPAPSKDEKPSTQPAPTSQPSTPPTSTTVPATTTSAKTIDDVATNLGVKQSGYCRALAPKDWAFVTNQEATGADLFSPDKSMHAGWGIAGVYTYMYETPEVFLNAWMPLAGYTGFSMGGSKNLDYDFVQRDFTSGIGKKGTLIYKTYNFGDPTLYVVSVYFAAANNDIWESKGAIPSYSAISIRCVSQLRPSTSSVDVSSSNPSRSSDNPEVSLSDKWTEAIMGYENVYSPSTGDHYEAPLTSKWDTGPDGPGYYRSIPNGVEKLERGFGSY